MHRSQYFNLLTFALAFCIALPATADWLVTHDGSRIETQGPWTLAGRSVVFTQTNGTLSSVRASRVDLAASNQASMASYEPSATSALTPSASPEPVMILTDRDVAGYRSLPSDYESSTSQETPLSTEDSGSASRVIVQAWEQVRDPRNTDGVEIVGTLLNQGDGLATNLKVAVLLYDEEDVLIGAVPAALPVKAIPPHKATKFRVLFPGVVTFAHARFEIRSHNVKFVPLNFDLEETE
jgi:hypothetical protein